MFYFSLDGHTMRVIEVDGVETQPLEASVIPISTAQRYSVLVTARNDTSSNFAIHANMDPDMFDAIPDELQLSTSRCFPTAPGSETPKCGANE
jgi:iron transport multicopper oxidase